MGRRSWTIRSRREAARARAEEEAIRPFDLAHGPLVRFRLLCLGPEEHILMLTLHHVAVDGWSLRVLAEEFEQLFKRGFGLHRHKNGDTTDWRYDYFFFFEADLRSYHDNNILNNVITTSTFFYNR